MPAIHATSLKTLLGLGVLDDLRGRVTRAGNPGEGGGENSKWLKEVNRDDVADKGPFSC